jgi:hypothetical protein
LHNLQSVPNTNPNPSASSPGSAALTRTIVVCDACGCDPGDEPAPVRGCPDHGKVLTEVECLRASALTGRTPVTAADLTPAQVQKVQAFIGGIPREKRTAQEVAVNDACARVLCGAMSPRGLVADAFNALFGGVTEAA